LPTTITLLQTLLAAASHSQDHSHCLPYLPATTPAVPAACLPCRQFGHFVGPRFGTHTCWAVCILTCRAHAHHCCLHAAATTHFLGYSSLTFTTHCLQVCLPHLSYLPLRCHTPAFWSTHLRTHHCTQVLVCYTFCLLHTLLPPLGSTPAAASLHCHTLPPDHAARSPRTTHTRLLLCHHGLGPIPPGTTPHPTGTPHGTDISTCLLPHAATYLPAAALPHGPRTPAHTLPHHCLPHAFTARTCTHTQGSPPALPHLPHYRCPSAARHTSPLPCHLHRTTLSPHLPRTHSHCLRALRRTSHCTHGLPLRLDPATCLLPPHMPGFCHRTAACHTCTAHATPASAPLFPLHTTCTTPLHTTHTSPAHLTALHAVPLLVVFRACLTTISTASFFAAPTPPAWTGCLLPSYTRTFCYTFVHRLVCHTAHCLPLLPTTPLPPPPLPHLAPALPTLIHWPYPTHRPTVPHTTHRGHTHYLPFHTHLPPLHCHPATHHTAHCTASPPPHLTTHTHRDCTPAPHLPPLHHHHHCPTTPLPHTTHTAHCTPAHTCTPTCTSHCLTHTCPPFTRPPHSST